MESKNILGGLVQRKPPANHIVRHSPSGIHILPQNVLGLPPTQGHLSRRQTAGATWQRGKGASWSPGKAAADASFSRLPWFLSFGKHSSPEGVKHHLEYRT